MDEIGRAEQRGEEKAIKRMGWPKGKPRGPRRISGSFTETPSAAKIAKAPANPRAQAVLGQRRRRSDTYRGYDLRLDVPEHLKDPNYEYRWINDEKGRLQQRTTQDDWDFVDKNELAIPSHDDGKDKNETDGRIRREVTSQTSPRPIYAYLCKKRKEYCEADFREEMNLNRERMRGTIRRQYTGVSADADTAEKRDFEQHAYVPKTIQTAIDVTESRIRRARPRDDGAEA